MLYPSAPSNTDLLSFAALKRSGGFTGWLPVAANSKQQQALTFGDARDNLFDADACKVARTPEPKSQPNPNPNLT